MIGVVPFPHPYLKGVAKAEVTDRKGGGYKIRIGGHLMPENSGVTPSPSTAKCWYWGGGSEDVFQSATSSLIEGDHI